MALVAGPLAASLHLAGGDFRMGVIYPRQQVTSLHFFDKALGGAKAQDVSLICEWSIDGMHGNAIRSR